MKKGLLLALAIICCASLAFAQPPGSVAVYADNLGGGCSFNTGGGFISLHYFHAGSPGATAVEFQSTIMDDFPAGTWNFFGDNSTWTLKQGLFHDGCAIAYGDCVSGDIYLGSSAYQVLSAPGACSLFYTTGHPVPSSPGVTDPMAVDCADNLVVLRGSFAVINPDESCPCPGTIPNEETSWGQIKSLYN